MTRHGKRSARQQARPVPGLRIMPETRGPCTPGSARPSGRSTRRHAAKNVPVSANTDGDGRLPPICVPVSAATPAETGTDVYKRPLLYGKHTPLFATTMPAAYPFLRATYGSKQRCVPISACCDAETGTPARETGPQKQVRFPLTPMRRLAETGTPSISDRLPSPWVISLFVRRNRYGT